jgi:amidase
VSPAPYVPGSLGLGTSGPIARTVRDAAALLDVMSGYETGDFYVAPEPERPFLAEAEIDPGRLRIAFTVEPPIDVPVDPACVAAAREAAALLAELGHDVTEDTPAWNEDMMYAFFELWCARAAAHDPMPDFEELEPINQALIERGRAMRATDVGAALRRLHGGSRRVLRFFEHYDLLVLPVVIIPPPVIGEFKDPAQPLAEFVRSGSFTPFTAFWNSTGQTAASVPLAQDEQGLPVGVQIVARPADEATLIRVSAQLEEARPWADRPPGFA